VREVGPDGAAVTPDEQRPAAAVVTAAQPPRNAEC
jgi:hypothetical protein